MNVRPIGEPVEGCDGGLYQQVELLDDLSHINPYKRPPKIVWQTIKEGRRVETDTSLTRLSLTTHHKLKGKDIRGLRGSNSGPVVVLCNGSSLAQHDLFRLKYDLIGMNRTYQGFPGYSGPTPKYYTYIDCPWSGKADDCKSTMINMSMQGNSNHYRVVKSYRMKPWSWDLWMDGVVPVNTGYASLQVAAYMGYNPIYVMGMDYASDKKTPSKNWNQVWGEEKHFDGSISGQGLQVQPEWLPKAAEAVKGRLEIYFVGSPNNGSNAFPHLTFEEICQRQ